MTSLDAPLPGDPIPMPRPSVTLASLTVTLGIPSQPLKEPPGQAYRDHLRHVTNDLHRKLTGCRTGTSAYKGLYGRWCQAQEDLAAWERLDGGETGGGGPK